MSSTFTLANGLNLCGYKFDSLVLVEAASDWLHDIYPSLLLGAYKNWLPLAYEPFIGEPSEKKALAPSPARSAAEMCWSNVVFLLWGAWTGFRIPWGLGIVFVWSSGLTPLGNDDLPLSIIGDRSFALSEEVPLKFLGAFTYDNYCENSLWLSRTDMPSFDAPLPEYCTLYYWLVPSGLGEPEIPRFLLLLDYTLKSFWVLSILCMFYLSFNMFNWCCWDMAPCSLPWNVDGP